MADSAKLSLEELFSSRGRFRVLKVLLLSEELNVSEIARRAQLNHTATISHLNFLKRHGLIREKRYGKIRIYCLENDNPYVKLLKDFIFTFESLSFQRT